MDWKTIFQKAVNKGDTVSASQIRNIVEQQECLSSQGRQFIVYYDESLTVTTSQQPTAVTLASWRSYS